MKFELNTELKNRIIQGIEEAKNIIAKEMQYSEKFQNKAIIAQSVAHIEKMNAALNANFLVVE